MAACRAVLCASLWPDPADALCPKEFIEFAQNEMTKWSDNEHLLLLSKESYEHFIKVNHDKTQIENKTFLRTLLLDFIADFANWNKGNNIDFLKTANSLTNIAHISFGGQLETKPVLLDPFAGGGSIPLEGLRVGTESFASDLNPIPILLNKVQLEYIPKYGNKLSEEVQKWGDWMQEKAVKILKKYYTGIKKPSVEYYVPQVQKTIKKGQINWKFDRIIEDIPNAYIWARTINCEGPNCGVKIPLLRTTYLVKKGAKSIGLKILANDKKINFQIISGIKPKEANGTIQRGSTTCPCCGHVTKLDNVKTQLKLKKGGAEDAIPICVISSIKSVRSSNKKTELFNEVGKFYRLPHADDIIAFKNATKDYEAFLEMNPNLIPMESTKEYVAFVNRGPLYGMDKWVDYFAKRQKLTIATFLILLEEVKKEIKNQSVDFKKAIITILAFAIDKQIDSVSSLTRWQANRETNSNTFGRQALPMVWDFFEPVPITKSAGSFHGLLSWPINVIENLSIINYPGNATQSDVTKHFLPDDSCDIVFTDPPYYYSVQYSDLSDFFYVWLKRMLNTEYPELFKNELAPKENEIIVQSPTHQNAKEGKNRAYYEDLMFKALCESRRIAKPNGICVIVFAHTETSGWESLLNAIIRSGWIITGSWPIDTELANRIIGYNKAVLASSVHLVCRPRENEDGSLIKDQIGDWRDVQEELPKRIHEWMPRLAAEGVAGADAIFACLGPALEIFSRYSSVEKPNGDVVSLREYLEKVWAAVSQEALNMVFTGGEAQGLEEDARLTAMWLWTLTAGASANSTNDEEDESDEEENSSSGGKLTGGFILEYDTARKIAQGLGANLEELKTLVEVKGDKARLLPVMERTSKLFGSSGINHQPVRKKKTDEQLTLFFENTEPETESKYEMPELKVEQTGKTVLDRLHQAMLLFSTGRTEALKRFLVEEGAGKDDRFWKLAQSLTSLYPKDTDERRWVEAVQTYKKNLGF